MLELKHVAALTKPLAVASTRNRAELLGWKCVSFSAGVCVCWCWVTQCVGVWFSDATCFSSRGGAVLFHVFLSTLASSSTLKPHALVAEGLINS